jgi:hypothetical protein
VRLPLARLWDAAVFKALSEARNGSCANITRGPQISFAVITPKFFPPSDGSGRPRAFNFPTHVFIEQRLGF